MAAEGRDKKASAITDTVGFLKREFDRRRVKNPAYSLRAFARQLGVSSGRLSEVLSGKRGISGSTAAQLATRLQLTESEKKEFIQGSEHHRKSQKALRGLIHTSLTEKDYHQVDGATLEFICRWEDFGILSLLRTAEFKSDIDWIADRLMISVKDTKAAINRLEKSGLIIRDQGKWYRTREKIRTAYDEKSEVIQKFHLEGFRHCIDQIPRTMVNDREVCTAVLPINPKKIPEAKKLIRNFIHMLSTLVEVDEMTDVYSISVGFVPITKRKS